MLIFPLLIFIIFLCFTLFGSIFMNFYENKHDFRLMQITLDKEGNFLIIPKKNKTT